MANIKNNNHRKIDCRLINDEYMDFMLSKEDAISNNHLLDTCLAAKLNFFNHTDKHVISDVSWSESVPSDKVLENIGYTGVDNGFITYEKDRIGNDEFLDLYVNSTFDLSTYGDKFFVTEVNGNSGMLVYPIEVKSDYTALKGGFYQGFFKIDGDKYQTLPHHIKNEWNFNITLRKHEYETPSNILNKRYNENKGVFFFIGTRSENKFWELYKAQNKMKELKYHDSDEYSPDYNIMDSCVIKHQYHEDTPDTNKPYNGYADACDCLDYFENGFNPYNETPTDGKSCINDYFSDDYTNTACDCIDNGLAIDDDYIQEQLQLDGLKLEDSKGNTIGEKGFYEIETDNKFIIFNNTKDGFNTKTWKDEYKFVLTGKKDAPNINYFPYLNHTKEGYTKENIDSLIEEHSYAYDVFKDIEHNALGVKLNDDGSISYRYISTNCEIIEETSKPNLVKDDEWTNIHIKIIRKATKQPSECDDHYKQGKMQIYIYVNGFLKLVSKELPELMLKPLDDGSERQEAVPYSISIGGGSQGLSERILLDYYDLTDYILPIEKNFGGSFIGDIKQFTFIPCQVDFSFISQKGRGFHS
jgi:hypothetical protein